MIRSSLNDDMLEEIIATRDYSLATAARPALGDYAAWFTVILAMLTTAGGIIASIFAVSRILAMLTEMKLVPHRHFHMPGSVQKHTLVYTIVLGLLLTAFFDLARITALGIIFYLGALKNQVQHYLERMLHGKKLQAVEH